jgi:LysR family glycine cleavage system transcriptional activator
VARTFAREGAKVFLSGRTLSKVQRVADELGIQLFKPERQKLVITIAGREYLNVVRTALDHIAADTERLLKHQHSGVLTVSTSPDFAAKWLVPRLSRFTEAHAEIDLRISATTPCVDFTREDVDVAVRHVHRRAILTP